MTTGVGQPHRILRRDRAQRVVGRKALDRPRGRLVPLGKPGSVSRPHVRFVFGRADVGRSVHGFGHGRIDLSTHPFCSGFDMGDVRLTTRVKERDLKTCLFGSIHEAGHGLYEQGLDPKVAKRAAGTLAQNTQHADRNR